jgi:hypothetical protein
MIPIERKKTTSCKLEEDMSTGHCTGYTNTSTHKQNEKTTNRNISKTMKSTITQRENP